MRIIWVSTSPFLGDGFGQQSHLICRELSLLGHEIHFLAQSRVGEGASDLWLMDGHVVQSEIGSKLPHARYLYRLYMSDEVGGRETLQLMLKNFAVDVVVSLGDLYKVDWVGGTTKLMRVPWVYYAPVDYVDSEADWVKFFMEFDTHVVAMSQHGKKMFEEHDLDVDYIPHGIDLDLFHKMSDAKGAVRQSIGMPNRWTVGFVGVNVERKRLDVALEAFCKFAKDKRDVQMSMHTGFIGKDPNQYGFDVARIINKLNLVDKVKVTNPLQYAQRLPRRFMPKLMNAHDVLILPTMGEGFGLPIIESEACGVPVITTNTTSCPELVQDHGWLVEPAAYIDHYGFKRAIPDVNGFVEALEEAYGDKKKLGLFGSKAVTHARDYDIKRLTKTWEETLEKVIR